MNPLPLMFLWEADPSLAEFTAKLDSSTSFWSWLSTMVDRRSLDELQAQPEQIVRQLFSGQWRAHRADCLTREQARVNEVNRKTQAKRDAATRAALDEIIERVKDLAGMSNKEIVHDYLKDL